jgi:hypothetical protein
VSSELALSQQNCNRLETERNSMANECARSQKTLNISESDLQKAQVQIAQLQQLLHGQTANASKECDPRARFYYFIRCNTHVHTTALLCIRKQRYVAHLFLQQPPRTCTKSIIPNALLATQLSLAAHLVGNSSHVVTSHNAWQ